MAEQSSQAFRQRDGGGRNTRHITHRKARQSSEWQSFKKDLGKLSFRSSRTLDFDGISSSNAIIGTPTSAIDTVDRRSPPPAPPPLPLPPLDCLIGSHYVAAIIIIQGFFTAVPQSTGFGSRPDCHTERDTRRSIE
ncbi:hypothetical protein V1477_019303, partial [Vespula maculifrons]